MKFLARLRRLIATKHYRVKVTWIGLDGAGKTTLIKRIVEQEFDTQTEMTIGVSIEEVAFKEGLIFISWDVGGQYGLRATLWESFMTGTLGVIYVVDSADTGRLQEAKEELWKYVVENSQLDQQVSILVLANKQDLPNALPAREVAIALDLERLDRQRYALFPVSAKTGFNIDEALKWLAQQIQKNISHI
ncbi:MAG: ADP-ribosylation factor family protein [Candidatus Hermodarchaeota archaeon]